MHLRSSQREAGAHFLLALNSALPPMAPLKVPALANSYCYGGITQTTISDMAEPPLLTKKLICLISQVDKVEAH